MKNRFKILSVFLLIILTISITACNVDNNQGVDGEENTSAVNENQQSNLEAESLEIDNIEKNNVENIENNVNNNQQISGSQGSALTVDSLFYLNDYSAYEEFLTLYRSKILPANFVTYDQISSMGDFVGFQNYDGSDFTEYFYTLADENNYVIKVIIEHLDLKSQYVHMWPGSIEFGSEIVDGTNDLLNISYTEEPGYVTIDNVTYYYSQGKLTFFEWIEDDVLYRLSLDQSGEYPTDGKQTMMAKFLTKSEVSSALTEFKSEMHKTEEIK